MLVLLVLVACTQGPSRGGVAREDPVLDDAMAMSDFRRVDHPEGWEYHGLAWLDQGIVVSTAAPFDARVPIPQQPDVADDRLRLLDLETGDFRELAIPPVAGCARAGHNAPHRLPDGRLGFSVHCADVARRISTFLYAYDLATGRAERLVDRQMPLPGYPYRVAWDVQLRRGVTSAEGSMLTVSPSGIEPFQVPEVDLAFATNVAAFSGVDRMAFIGSTDRRNANLRQDKVPFQADVYAAGLDGSGLQRLYERAWQPGPPSVSPDGRTVAVELTTDTPFVGADEHTGVWFLDVAGRSRRRLVQTAAPALAWSPDGRRLAMLADSPSGPPSGELSSNLQLYVGDVSAFLQ